MVMQATVSSGSSQKTKITHISQMRKCKYSIQEVCRRARSLARIKVSAFGAGDRGFKSHRARSLFGVGTTNSFICNNQYAREYCSIFGINCSNCDNNCVLYLEKKKIPDVFFFYRNLFI
jgi:hypothetical protein